MLNRARTYGPFLLASALFGSVLIVGVLSFYTLLGKSFSNKHPARVDQPVLPTAKFDEDQLTQLLQVLNNRSQAWQESTDYWERQTSGPKNRCVDGLPCKPREVKRSLKISISWTEKGGELGLTGDTFSTPAEAVEFLQHWDVEAYLDQHFGS